MKILIQIFKAFSRKEILIFTAAFLIFLSSFIFIVIDFFNKKTTLKPVFGGEYIEGIIGQPTFINPVIAGNNEADKNAVEVLFSNLLNLSESQKISEDGKIWDIRLKENVFWYDNQPITSDDVIFTIKTIQDPDSRSPLFSYWQGVLTERVSEREFKLILPEPYAFFESALEKLRPIPKHLFENIPPANLRLSEYNLEPIANGPFKFLSFEKDRSGFIKEYRLENNENYFGQKPYLKNLVFRYYQNEDELIKAFNNGEISGFGGLNPKNLSQININHQIFEMRSPKYYAVFLNSATQPAFNDKNVRLALNYATNRNLLIEKVFQGRALPVTGPLISGMTGFASQVYPKEDFSLEKANQILEAGGWQLNENGFREKKTKKELQHLEFNLTVPKVPFLIETAELLKEDWAKIGIKININIYPSTEINEKIIKSRSYEMILFGNTFSDADSPDLLSFWHSSERFYPGLNLSLYENKNADVLIESIRKNLNEKGRQRDLIALQSLIINDLPAIFLYSPNYLYVAKPSLKGFNSSNGRDIFFADNRFQNVENWYLKTARVFK